MKNKLKIVAIVALLASLLVAMVPVYSMNTAKEKKQCADQGLRFANRDSILAFLKAGLTAEELDRNLKQTPRKLTSLIIAAHSGDLEIVKLMLQKSDKKYIERSTRSGITPLMCAAINGRTDVVQALIEAKANLETKDRILGDTALLHAVANNHFDIVRMLVSARADINAANKNNTDPLLTAHLAGETSIERWLMRKGASTTQLKRHLTCVAFENASRQTSRVVQRRLTLQKRLADIQKKRELKAEIDQKAEASALAQERCQLKQEPLPSEYARLVHTMQSTSFQDRAPLGSEAAEALKNLSPKNNKPKQRAKKKNKKKKRGKQRRK